MTWNFNASGYRETPRTLECVTVYGGYKLLYEWTWYDSRTGWEVDWEPSSDPTVYATHDEAMKARARLLAQAL